MAVTCSKDITKERQRGRHGGSHLLHISNQQTNVYHTMKTVILLISLLPALGFLSRQVAYHRPTILGTTARERDEITHELEDLGADVRTQSMSPVEGFEEFHEGKFHKIKHEMHEKDRQWRKAVEELRRDLKQMEKRIDETRAMERMEKNVHEATENVLKKELDYFEEEHESVRVLLGDAFRLMGRRVRNGTGNSINGVLRFLRLKKKKQE